MQYDPKEFPKGIGWLGLLTIAIGLSPIYAAVYGPPEDIFAPKWVVIAAGMAFVNAGIGIGMMDGIFNPLRRLAWFNGFQMLALLSIPLLLLACFNWVAFFPGEREFSVSISIPFISGYFENANQLLGRLAFGIPTALVDIVLLAGLGRVFLDALISRYEKLIAWINEED